ncbi:hypothetical protein SAMD00023353_1302340 [Rosellinia necatrix]|uniref:Uncharacterized protein n=1 Tax=Rosellinia necatrix TaxID=77044 RepID=A0A1S8A730_ROSNE|nr:hypothetical protein SAMD00023353_1302340 [Rosellinia necatrix]
MPTFKRCLSRSEALSSEAIFGVFVDAANYRLKNANQAQECRSGSRSQDLDSGGGLEETM